MADRVVVRPEGARVVVRDDPAGGVVVVRAETRSRVVVRTQGPTGPSGAASSAYVHTQPSASDTWTIAHNLGFYPDVAVFTVGGVEVVAQVTHTSTLVTVVQFAAPMSGSARLS